MKQSLTLPQIDWRVGPFKFVNNFSVKNLTNSKDLPKESHNRSAQRLEPTSFEFAVRSSLHISSGKKEG